MGIYGDFKELIQLLESVKQLKVNTEKLANLVNEIDKRVVALEKGEEVVIEKAKSAAATSASVAAGKMAENILERVYRLEGAIARGEEPPAIGKD